MTDFTGLSNSLLGDGTADWVGTPEVNNGCAECSAAENSPTNCPGGTDAPVYKLTIRNNQSSLSPVIFSGYVSASAGYCSDSANCKAGGSSVLTNFDLSSVTKTGYTFTNVTTSIGSGQKVITDNRGNITDTTFYKTINADTTLYMDWSANVFRAGLDSKYYATSSTSTGSSVNTSAAPTPLYIKYNTGVYSDAATTTEITKLTTLPAKAGYTFQGFYSGKAGTGTKYINANGTFTTELTTAATSSGVTLTLYAHYTPVCIAHKVRIPNGNMAFIDSNYTVYMLTGDTKIYIDANCTQEMTADTFSTMNTTLTQNMASMGLARYQIAGYYMGVTPTTINGRFSTTMPLESDYLTPEFAVSKGLPENAYQTYTAQSRGFLMSPVNDIVSTNRSISVVGPATPSIIYTWIIRKPIATTYTTLQPIMDATGSVTGTGGSQIHMGGWEYVTTCPDNYTLANAGTYNATCRANSFSVVYDGNGATGGSAPSEAPTTCTVGSSCPVGGISYTKTGYNYTQWACTNLDGLTIKLLPGQRIGIGAENDTVTCKPDWQPNVFTVTFKANRGSGSMDDQTFTYDVAQALTQNAFTRTHYDFKGWSTSASASNATYTDKQSVSNLTATNAGTVTLYAVWAPKVYQLTIDLGGATGGSITYEGTTYSYGATNATRPCTYGVAYPALPAWDGKTSSANDGTYQNNLTKTNMVFTGWYGLNSKGNIVCEGNTTISAKWVAPTCTADATSVSESSLVNVTNNAPICSCTSKDGYHCLPQSTGTAGQTSMSISANATNDGFFALSGFVFPEACPVGTFSNKSSAATGCTPCPNGRTTAGQATKYNATATNACTVTCSNNANVDSWETTSWTTQNGASNVCTVKTCVAGYNLNNNACAANTYTVKFNANGGSGSMNNQDFTYGVAQALTTNAFTRTGYTFQGWSTSSTATTATYTDKHPISNLTMRNGVTVDLYAVWSPCTYSVKFNANNGSGSMSNQTFTYDVEQALTANAFTRTGYTFQGWATSASGQVVHTDKKTVSNLTATCGGTVNLYAVWGVNTYTVKFNSNGGFGSMSNQTFTYGVAQALTANAFTRTGYTFQGWATSASGQVVHTDKKTVSNLTATNGATVDLYAVWLANTATITLNKANTGANDTSTGTNTLYTKYDTGAYLDSARSMLMATNRNPLTIPQREFTVSFNATGATVSDRTATSVFRGYAAIAGGTAPTFVVDSNGYINQAGITAASTYTSDQTWTAGWTNGTITLPTATKTGYAVTEWYSDSALTNSVGKPGATYTPNASVTLYGKWGANAYTITIDKNGGSGKLTVNGTTATGVNDVVFTCSYGDTFTLPAYSNVASFTQNNMTRALHVFNGWSQTGTISCNGNKTITANWTKLSCVAGTGVASTSLSISNNVGTCSCSSKDGYYCSSQTITPSGTTTTKTVNATPAPNGHFALAGATKSTACAKGSYSTKSSASSSCTACPAGYTTSGTGTNYSSAPNSVCTVACTNNANVYGWVDKDDDKNPLEWTNNKVNNLCVIKTCQSTYVNTGNACTKCSCIKGTGVKMCTVTGSSDDTTQCEYSFTCNDGYGNGIGTHTSSGAVGVAANTMSCDASKQTVHLKSDYYKNETTTIEATTDADPSTLYYKFESGVYSDSNYTTKITKLTTLPKLENTCYSFQGFYHTKNPTALMTPLIDKEGNINQGLTVHEFSTIYSDSSLYAHYIPTSMTIKYEPGDGFVAEPESGSIAPFTSRICSYTGVAAGSCPASTADDFDFYKHGYTFTGWRCTGGGDKCDGDIYAPGADLSDANDGDCGTITLTALWSPNTFTVRFMSGNTLMASQEYTYDAEQALKSVSTMEQPVDYLTGWEFVGWSLNPNTTTKSFSDGEVISNLTQFNSSVPLYGIWKRDVNFKYYNGATATTTTTSKRTQYYRNTNTGTAAVTDVNTFDLVASTTYGWEPIGWVLNSPTNTTATSNATTASEKVTPSAGTFPLYTALYSRPVTLSYVANGATGGSMQPTNGTQYFNAGSTTAKALSLTLADNAFTKTGYTFKNWNINGTEYADSASVDFPNTQWTTRTNVQATAQWTANSNTKYVVNHYTKNLGATTYTLNSTENKTGTSDASLTLANLKKSITGFTYSEGFAGTATKGTTKPTSGAVATTTILPGGTRVIDLYYNRVITTITVSKNSGSGSLTVNGTPATGTTAVSFTCEYGATFTLPAWDNSKNALALTKKVFTGWDKTGTITCGTANQTITAQWTTPTCTAGTGVNTTSLKEVTNNKPVCNRSSKCGYYCSETQTGTAGATSMTTTCTKTDAGYYAAAGATAQTKADAGYYAAAGACSQTAISQGCFGGEGSSVACPNQCPAAETGWTLTSTTGLKVVTECTETTTPATSGSPIATICTAGTLTKKATSTTAWGTATASGLKAKSGRYVNGLTCSACAPGYYQGTNGSTATACTPADAGYYVPSAESDKQTACPAGTYQGSTGKTSCTDATAGTYTTDCKITSNSTACTGTSVCATNTYSDAKASECTPCATDKGYGNSSNHAGVASCKVTCSAGQYVASANAACTDVTSGYYRSGTETVSQGGTGTRKQCSALGAFYNASDSGRDADTDCYGTTTATKFIKTAKDATETSCGAGSYCAGGTKVYYTSTGGSTPCPADSFCTAAVSQPTECATLGGGLYKNSNAGSTKAENCYITTTGGYYVADADDTAQTQCPIKQYCATETLYWPDASVLNSKAENIGWHDCPATTNRTMTTIPDVYRPYAADGTVLTGTAASISSATIQGYATGLKSIAECRAIYSIQNIAGYLTDESVLYNTTTGKYDKPSGSAYYTRVNAGYWLNTRYGDAYCDNRKETDFQKTIYKRAIVCPAGSYCPGMSSMPKCYGNPYPAEGIGKYSCEADTTHYTLSAEKSTSINACYLTTESKKYVATAGAGQVTCLAGGACPGDTTVYYNESNKGRTPCENWKFAGSGATSCSSCPTLTSGWTKVDSTSTGWTSYTQCQQQQTPANCASGLIVKTATGTSAWGNASVKSDNALSAKQNYYVNDTTCSACSGLGNGYTTSDTGNTGGASACYTTCGAGQYVANQYSACVNAGVGYYAPGSKVNYGGVSIRSRGQCTAPLTTIGYGYGANEADDCGRILHAGDNTIYLRSEKRSSPSLRVKVGDQVFYGALSTSLQGALKVKKDNTQYSVVNDWQ